MDESNAVGEKNMEDQMYQDGVAAAKAGDMVSARRLFSEYIKQNPNSENGWLALGQCVDDVDLKAKCFRKVLSINPDNFTAHNLLQSLSQSHAIDQEIQRSVDVMDGEASTSKEPVFQRTSSLPAILGFFVGFIGIGGLFILFINANPPEIIDRLAHAFVPTPEEFSLENSAAQTAAVNMSLTPTGTPETIPSPTGEQFSTPSAPLTMSQRLIENYDKVENANQLMLYQHYAEAIFTWNEIIEAVPEYADAYFSRGICYLMLTYNQRFLQVYIENSQKAYDDFTKAIELGPPRGEYYYQRAEATRNLIDQYEFQIDQAPLYQHRLEDILQAYTLSNNEPWGTRSVGLALLEAGYCEESLDYFLRLEDERGQNASPSETINGFIAKDYVCLGQFEKALKYSDTAISIKESKGEDARWDKFRHSRILVALERYQEALEIINELLEKDPYYDGYRYYDRALLYYKLGMSELAYDDINFGSTQTWGQYGMRAYVLGLLALDEDDEDSALYWLQIAEASLSKFVFPYFYQNTHEEIDRLGGTYLYPTPTPSPTPVASPTLIPVIADEVYFTPTPASVISTPSLVNYSGTGIFYLGSGDEKIFLFRPEGYHDFTSIESLTLKVTAEDFTPGFQLSSYFMLLDGSGFVGSIPLFAGENDILNPYNVVSHTGYFHVRFYNGDRFPVVIENISVQLIVKDQDGTTVVYGYE